MITYKDVGVDIEGGNQWVQHIKRKAQSTYNNRVVEGVGGFASVYNLHQDKYLVASTDGVGTKILVAQELNQHTTIGIDLVAMCANDILCTGARGLFFMDYIAMGTLDSTRTEELLDGIIQGSTEAKLALVGGETAQMPDMYANGTYDLAGFAVGEVAKTDIITGNRIQNGDIIVGLASSGIHSNGLSLARKIAPTEAKQRHRFLHQLLTPTRIYTPFIEEIIDQKIPIHGIAHITGGGWRNIERINPHVSFHFRAMPTEIPSIFTEIQELSGISDLEMRNTFNMGVGMMLVSPRPHDIIDIVSKMGICAWVLGEVAC